VPLCSVTPANALSLDHIFFELLDGGSKPQNAASQFPPLLAGEGEGGVRAKRAAQATRRRKVHIAT